MAEPFIQFCEELWRDWLDGTLKLPDIILKKFGFDLDAAPEPYLHFETREKPLVVLTTNPGGTMCHQCRASVRAGEGPLSTSMSYEEAARALGPFYVKELPSVSPARRRIEQSQKLSCRLLYQGVFQVEAVPFHRPSLPANRKRALLDAIENDERSLLASYSERLQKFLLSQPVVAISAISPRGMERIEQSHYGDIACRWPAWMAGVAGLELERAKFVHLVGKTKATCAALVSCANETPKAIVLMIGGNNLPGDEGLRRLVEELQK